MSDNDIAKKKKITNFAIEYNRSYNLTGEEKKRKEWGRNLNNFIPVIISRNIAATIIHILMRIIKDIYIYFLN